MIDPKFIETIVKKTEVNIFRWQETAEDDAFRLMLRSGMILIQKYEDDYCLTIFDNRNREIEEVKASSSQPLFTSLKNLWKCAAGSAGNREGVLSEMMKEVDMA